jgi:L-lactate utilization protein LutC
MPSFASFPTLLRIIGLRTSRRIKRAVRCREARTGIQVGPESLECRRLLASVSLSETFDASAAQYALKNHYGSPASLSTVAGHGKVLNLTYEAIGGTLNTVAFNSLTPQPFVSMTAEFDVRMLQSSRADGLGFAFLNSAIFGDSGVAPPISEDPNVAGSFGVGFDTYFNDPFAFPGSLDAGSNDITLHYDGKQYASITLSDIDLANGNFLHVTVQATQIAYGCEISVTLRDMQTGKAVSPFNHFLIPGAVGYAGRPAFGARTGTNDSGIAIDNVSVTQNTPSVTVVPQRTPADRPTIAGTVDSTDATVIVSVAGRQYVASNDHNGNWSLPGDQLKSPLPPGMFDVAVAAVLPGGQVIQDVTQDDLWVIDAAKPSALIHATTSTVSGGLLPVVTFQLSEDVDDFVSGDILVTNGTLTGLSGTGSTYFATFNPSPSFQGEGTVSIPAAAFTSRSGKASIAASLQSPFAVNTLSPRVSVGAVNTRLNRGQATSIRFGLSEQTVNFTLGDISASGGTISDLQGGGAGYWATFTATPGFVGIGSVGVVANAFSNSLQTPSLAGTLAVPLSIGQSRAPVSPSELLASPGNSQVSLSWTAPTDNGGSAITDYAIQYSSDGGLSWTSFPHSASAASAATVTGLSNGTSYVFQVAAVNEAGTGSWSANSSSVTPRTVPSAPLSLIGTPGNGQVLLSWTLPTSNGGSPITNYTIDVSSNGGLSWTSFPHSVSAATTATVTGLTNGSSYWFKVGVSNAAGTGLITAAIGPIVPRTVPEVPANVIATPGVSQVSLSWTAPSSNGGSPITDYTIQYSTNGGATWTPFTDGTSTATTATITGLTNGSDYMFHVAAVNVAGTGGWSLSFSAVTPRTVPTLPTSVIGTVGNSQVSLNWTAPTDNGGSAITDYAIQYSSDGGLSWTSFPHSASAASAATVTGLSNGTSYVFQVAAVNEAGTGSWSANSSSVTPRTVPSAPLSLIGTPGNGQALLSWTLPTSNGGSPITDYTIQYSTNGGATWTPFTDGTSTATTATITGLTNGSDYMFHVAAVNVAGTGGWSLSFSAVTPRTVPALPTSVIGIVGNSQVSLSWTAPTDNGGSAITDYAIQYSSDSGLSWTSFPHSASAASAATVTGLSNGTSYVFQVAAVNEAGTGSWSAASRSVVPLPSPAAPGRPSVTLASTAASLSWTGPRITGGLRIVDYVIDYSSDGGSTWTRASERVSASTAASIGGLINGTTYVFRVAAVTAGGVGAFSASSAPVIPFLRTAIPAAPTSVAGVGSSGTVSLSWAASSSNAGGPIRDYVIQYRSVAAGSRWLAYNDGVTSANTATVRRLVPGRAYVFRVAAKNLAGTGAFSSPSAVIRA